MDHITRRHVSRGGLDRLSEADGRLLIRLALHIRPAGARNRRSHTAAGGELSVGRVGDRVDLEPGHVDLMDFYIDHRHILSRAPPRGHAMPNCVASYAVSARAGIVVTGTEVLTGRVQDRNGPWIADRLLELGVELAHITICGDRAADIEAQLLFLADEGVDLIVTSGGLGPTADDMTVATVARFCGRELVLDAELENKIAAILKKLMASIGGHDFDAVRAANCKQAMVPVGALVMDPVGTAPGVVVPGKPTVVVLPGPPRELQPMWRTAVQIPA